MKWFILLFAALGSFGFCDFFWAFDHGLYRAVLDATLLLTALAGAGLFGPELL